MSQSRTDVVTTNERTRVPAHPLANLFPMLQGDDLADLAAVMRQSSLRQPIVPNDDNVLRDTNRLSAHRLAGTNDHALSLVASTNSAGVVLVLGTVAEVPNITVKEYVLSLTLKDADLGLGPKLVAPAP